MTDPLQALAALPGAIILSVTLAGQPAFAQGVNDAACPCFSGAQIDERFARLGPSGVQPGANFSCASGPDQTTFDYFDRAAPGPSPTAFLIDVLYQAGQRPPRCALTSSHMANDDDNRPGGTGVEWEITSTQALACRREILVSEAWSFFGCPNR